MFKKVKCFILGILITVSVINITGCKKIAELFDGTGELEAINLIAGDQSILVSWTAKGMYRSHIMVEFWETNSRENGAWWKYDSESDQNCMTIAGLKNDTNYTVRVAVLDTNEKTISEQQNTCIPTSNLASKSYYAEYNYNGEKSSFVKVPKGKSIIKINGVNGKKITFANYNSKHAGRTDSTNVIKASDVRRYAIPYVNSYYNPSRSIAIAADTIPEVAESNNPFTRHFTPPAEDSIKLISNHSRANSTEEPKETFSYTSTTVPQIGQTKKIWVDTDVNISKFQQELMTLYAIGYEPGTEKIKCFVWANSQNISDESKEDKVSLSMISDITQKFIKYYQLEEAIFGDTYDEIFVSNTSTSSINNYSTRDAVNIVLTDIGKDGITEECGVGGYFWGKDYYDTNHPSAKLNKSVASSNMGKYFYIDIPYCNFNGTDYSGNNNEISNYSISTLFHEYQHMINMNTKMYAKASADNSGDSWYNEMLSMLCEDLLQHAMGLGDNVQSERIPGFNARYYLSGTAQYIQNGDTGASYSTAYTFGSWLARNYGGAALVTELSQNDRVGTASIVAAVNAINSGKNATWESLMEEYIQAVGFKSDYAVPQNLPTHNFINPEKEGFSKTVTVPSSNYTIAKIEDEALTSENKTVSAQTITGTFTNPIDLWAPEYCPKYKDTDKKFFGPAHFNSSYYIDLQPTGFFFHALYDEVDTDSVTLYFTSGSDDDQELYLFIQDKYPFSE